MEDMINIRIYVAIATLIYLVGYIYFTWIEREEYDRVSSCIVGYILCLLFPITMPMIAIVAIVESSPWLTKERNWFWHKEPKRAQKSRHL